MKLFWKKMLFIGVPIIGAAGILWWVSKKSGEDEGPGPNSSATGKTAPKLKPVPAPKNSAFPLKEGSNNSYVGQLQGILDIANDNQFGPQTKAALIEQAGVSMVQDENQLNDIINKIKANDAGVNKAAKANQLLNTFNAGGYALLGIQTSSWTQVTQDYAGALIPTGKAITMYKGTTYNNNDYKIIGVSKLGNLIIRITNGQAAGLYSGDPETMTLKAVTPADTSTDSTYMGI